MPKHITVNRKINNKALSNDITLDKADVGLSAVDNTADLSKPISTLAKQALDAKSSLVHTHTVADITDFNTVINSKLSGLSNTGNFTGSIATDLTITDSSKGLVLLDSVNNSYYRITIEEGSLVTTLISGAGTTTPSGGSTTPGGGSATPGVPTFTQADATIGRIDRTAMSDVNIANTASLKTYLNQTVTNKRLILADGDYTGFFEQKGNWSNVELTSLTGNARLLCTDSTTNMIFQGNAARTHVAITNIHFENTTASSGYPMLWWNELPIIDGLEIANCSFTAPNGDFNAIGCVQYSVVSGTGNIAKNVYIHNNTFTNIGRIAIELLSQGYDTPRLFNLTINDNTFNNLGINSEFGMAFSLSGLIRQITCKNNVANQTRKIAYEYVNTQDVISDNNSATSTKDGVGYGISDDDHNSTRSIYITGGTFDMGERPFYIYGSSDVHMDAQNKLWKGHKGVDMNAHSCSFKNMNILVQSTVIESGWQFGGTTNNCTVIDSTVSSAGSVAAGFTPSYESVVLRSGAHNNTLTNVTTILGTQANGQPLAPANNGGDGGIVDQGTNNTITNNIKSVVA